MSIPRLVPLLFGAFSHESLLIYPMSNTIPRLFGHFTYDSLPKCPFPASLRSFLELFTRISSHISIFLLRRPPSGLFTYKSLSKSPIAGYSACISGHFPYDSLPKCPFPASLRSFLELFLMNLFSYIQNSTQSPASSDLLHMIHFLNVQSPSFPALFRISYVRNTSKDQNINHTATKTPEAI